MLNPYRYAGQAGFNPDSGVTSATMIGWYEADDSCEVSVGVPASDERFSTWKDKTSFNNDLTNGGALTTKPFFTNTDNKYLGNSSVNFFPTTNCNFFFPSNMFDTVTGAHIFILSYIPTDPPSIIQRGGMMRVGSDPTLSDHWTVTDRSIYSGFASTARKACGIYGPNLEYPVVAAIHSETNDWGLRIEEVVQHSTITNTVGFTADPYIGVSLNGSYAWTARVRAIYVYDGKLSDADRDNVVAHLQGMKSFPAPLHYWNMDDDGVWADSAGSWNGTESGTVDVEVGTGPNGQDVALFNANGDIIDLGDHNPVTDGLAHDFTISTWVKFSSLNSGSFGNYFYSWRSNATTLYNWDLLYKGDATDRLTLIGPTDAAPEAVASAITPVLTTKWYHVLATWGKETGQGGKLYIDGVLQGTHVSVAAPPNASMNVRFGNAGNTVAGTSQFLGRMCMTGMWDVEFNQSEVDYIFNNGDGRQFNEI